MRARLLVCPATSHPGISEWAHARQDYGQEGLFPHDSE